MNDTVPVLYFVLGCVTILGALYAVFSKMGAMELKVNTMWAFLMRRAWGEAITKKIIEVDDDEG